MGSIHRFQLPDGNPVYIATASVNAVLPDPANRQPQPYQTLIVLECGREIPVMGQPESIAAELWPDIP